MLKTVTGNFIQSESLGSYPGDPWYDDNLVFGYNSTNSAHQTIYLTFVTPSFIGNSKEISFCIQGQFGLTSVKFRYALCSSNANRDLYKSSNGKLVSDPYQLTTGITSITEKGTGYTTGIDKFTLTLSDVTLKSNTKYYLFFWLTENDHGYIGKNGEFIIRRLESINHLPYCTYTLTYNNACVCIDDDSGFKQYRCYIDTANSKVTISKNCSIIGQRSIVGHPGYTHVGIISDYDTTSNGYWGHSYDYDENNDTRPANHLYYLKFKTPENLNNPVKLAIAIKMHGSNYVDTNTTMSYALCSSDETYQAYALSGYIDDYPYDDGHRKFEITYGMFTENTSADGVSNIVINELSLSPNTIYYLVVCDTKHSYYYGGPTTIVKPASNHSIVITYDNYECTYQPYIPYIDNGTTWEPL